MRDAILQMQYEGFVTFLPQRGTRINEPSREDIEHLYELLVALDFRILLAIFDLDAKPGYRRHNLGGDINR